MHRAISLAALVLLPVGCEQGRFSDETSSDTGEEVATATTQQALTESVCTRLHLELHRSGAVQVLDATEQPGQCRSSKTLAGDFIYEAYQSGTVVATGGFMYPFQQRGAERGLDGGSVKEMDVGEVVIKVPGLRLTSSGFSIKIRRITEVPTFKVAGQTAAQPTQVLSDFGRVSEADLSASLISKGRVLTGH
jgi:hypothetical protein